MVWDLLQNFDFFWIFDSPNLPKWTLAFFGNFIISLTGPENPLKGAGGFSPNFSTRCFWYPTPLCSDHLTIGLSDYRTIRLSDYRTIGLFFFFFANYSMFGLKTISAKDVKGSQFRMVFILYPALRVKSSKIWQSALGWVRIGQNGPKIKIFKNVPNHS